MVIGLNGYLVCKEHAQSRDAILLFDGCWDLMTGSMHDAMSGHGRTRAAKPNRVLAFNELAVVVVLKDAVHVLSSSSEKRHSSKTQGAQYRK
jgi:hypothetical protein